MILRLIDPEMPTFEAISKHLEPSYAQGIFSNNGPACLEFEYRMCERYGFEDCALVANATVGLTSVLEVLNLYGSDVYLPDFTFIATHHSIANAGSTPATMPVDKNGFLDLNETKKTILSKDQKSGTLVLVHRLGQIPPNLADYENYAQESLSTLIVDAAATLNAERYPFKIHTATVFSLHATKTFGIGEGGLIAGKKRFIDQVKQHINFGFDSNKNSVVIGSNFKVSEFTAAVGLAKLDMIDRVHEERSKSWAAWSKRFTAAPSHIADYQGYQLFPAIFEDKYARDQAEVYLKANGVETRKYYTPISENTAGTPPEIEGYHCTFQEKILCLPCHSKVHQFLESYSI